MSINISLVYLLSLGQNFRPPPQKKKKKKNTLNPTRFFSQNLNHFFPWSKECFHKNKAFWLIRFWAISHTDTRTHKGVTKKAARQNWRSLNVNNDELINGGFHMYDICKTSEYCLFLQDPCPLGRVEWMTLASHNVVGLPYRNYPLPPTLLPNYCFTLHGLLVT